MKLKNYAFGAIFLVFILLYVVPEFFSIENPSAEKVGLANQALENPKKVLASKKSGQQKITDKGFSEINKSTPHMPLEVLISNGFSAVELNEAKSSIENLRQRVKSMYARFKWNKKGEEEEKLKVLDDIMKSAKKGDVEALIRVGEIDRSCRVFRRSGEPCSSVRKWKREMRKANKNFSVFDQLDKRAREGDLLAQYNYARSLMDAVVSKDMNTAINGQLWLERRQRMIRYLLKFSKAGSYRAASTMGFVLDNAIFIEPNPFWAAVFFSQTAYLKGGKYQNFPDALIDKHQLDSDKIENARQTLFGS